MGSSISFRSLLSLLLIAGCLLSTRAVAAPHPSLLFDEADIPKTRAHLDGPLRQVRDALVAGIRFPYTGGDFPKHPNLNWYLFSDRRSIADTLLAFSFGATFLDPSTQAGREARELAHNYLTGICRYHDWVFPETQDGPDPDLNSAHFLFAVSLAYDWLYHSLPESERRLCRDKVAYEGDKVYRAMLREAWWMPDLLQNHNWINTASLGVAALAFEGELPGVDTSRWLAAVEDNLEKVHYVLDQIEGGAWHEGTGYLNYGLDSLIPFSIALERRHGGPNYADNTIVRDYPKLRRFMMPPAQHHRRGYVFWGDFSGLDNENTLLSVFYAAKKGWDPHAGWYAKQYLEGALPNRSSFTSWPPGQRGLLIASIVYDQNMSVVPPSEGRAWDLDYFAKDLSLWTSRSSWSDGGSLLAFKNGVFGGHANFQRLSKGDVWPGGSINFGHDHADDMGVHFFADGEWLTTRVPGYWIGRDNGAPQVNRTRYANSLLVDDRGQLGEGLRTCWMRSCPWFFERIGTINHVGSTAHYSYAIGAGSQLYPRDMELETFGRSVLFVERNIPVIRDVVRARSPRRFEIVYHAMDGAARDGDWIRLHAKNGRALGVKVVAPAQFETRTENQHAVHLNKFDPDGAMTAVMIRPRQQSASTTFLTALAPVRAQNWGSDRPSITALDPASPETGLRIRGLAHGEKIDVAFNEAPSHTVSAAGLEVTGMAGVRKTREGEVVRVMLAVGSRLALDGRTWLEVLSPEPATVELDYGENGLSVTGDPAPIRVYAPGVREVHFNGEPVAFSRSGDTIQIPPADEEDPGEDPGSGDPGEEEPEPGDGGDDEGQGGAPGCGGCNAGGTGGSGGSGGQPGSGGCWGSGGSGGSDDEGSAGGDDEGLNDDDGSDGGDDEGSDEGDGSDVEDDEGTGGSDGSDEGGDGDDSDGAGGAGGSDGSGDDDGAGGAGGSDGSAEPPGAGGAGGDDSEDDPDGGLPGDDSDDEGAGGGRVEKEKKKGLFRCSAGSASQASPLGLTMLALALGSRRRRAD